LRFPCQKHHIDTVPIYGSGQPYLKVSKVRSTSDQSVAYEWPISAAYKCDQRIVSMWSGSVPTRDLRCVCRWSGCCWPQVIKAFFTCYQRTVYRELKCAVACQATRMSAPLFCRQTSSIYPPDHFALSIWWWRQAAYQNGFISIKYVGSSFHRLQLFFFHQHSPPLAPPLGPSPKGLAALSHPGVPFYPSTLTTSCPTPRCFS